MNSVASVLQHSAIFQRFLAFGAAQDADGTQARPIGLELEGRVGKLMQWRSRYRMPYLTETLVQTSTISLSDEQLRELIKSLATTPVIPSAVLARDGQATELTFSPEIPPAHFAFITGVHKLHFEDFVQKSDGQTGPIQLRQRDDARGRCVERIAKIRLANFDVATKFDFDYRISLSLECPCAEFPVKSSDVRRRASFVFDGVQCDFTEAEHGFQIELEALAAANSLRRIVDRSREVCAVLSDYCRVYAGAAQEQKQEEKKLEDADGNEEHDSAEGKQEEISDEFE